VLFQLLFDSIRGDVEKFFSKNTKLENDMEKILVVSEQ